MQKLDIYKFSTCTSHASDGDAKTDDDDDDGPRRWELRASGRDLAKFTFQKVEINAIRSM
jgi:hypothetical protein